MSRMGDPENPSDDEYGISRVKIKKRPRKWRPKSREETPKKGMSSAKRRTPFICAPGVKNSSLLTDICGRKDTQIMSVAI